MAKSQKTKGIGWEGKGRVGEVGVRVEGLEEGEDEGKVHRGGSTRKL